MAIRLQKSISTRPVKDTDLIERMNREIIPSLLESRRALQNLVGGGAVITGSRSGDPIGVMTQVLTALSSAGIITDQTTA